MTSQDIGELIAHTWAANLANMVREVELELIRMIRLSVSQELGANWYTVDRLAHIAVVYANTQRLLGGEWQPILDEAEHVLRMARDAGQGTAITDLRNAGLPVELPPQMAYGMYMTAMDTVAALTSMTPVILRRVVDEYQTLMRGPVSQLTLGATARVEATQKALIDWARSGIPGFVDRAGREWSMDAYAEMAVRTGAANSMREGYMATLVEFDHDLVRVDGVGYTCDKCAPWQGKVLSARGMTPTGTVQVMHATEDRMVTIDVAGTVAEATKEGMFHPNCVHGVAAYFPGITTLEPTGSRTSEKLSQETYEASQRQRALELEIRKTKRAMAAAFTEDMWHELNIEKLAYQKQIRDLLGEYPMLQRKPLREQIKTAH